ncbi:MAG: hypothetical protein Q7O66_17495 [Dehalococcoidia bacterium]|nr:hypothetical protein [Dehalococcoidia bacterium]
MAYDDGGTAEYGQQNADGTVSVIHQNDDGSYVVRRTESMQVNQGIAPTPAPSAFTGSGGAGILPLQIQQANQAYLEARLREVERPTYELARAQNDWQKLQAMAGLTGYLNTGGTPTMGADAALDAIWAKRPDLANFFRSSGWPVDTPEQQRAAVKNWLGFSPEGVSSGGDPVKAAQAMGIDVGLTGATQQNTLARDQMQQQNEQYYGGLRAQLSGPTDWLKVRQAQPKGAFGEMQATPSWESAGMGATSNADWWKQATSTGRGEGTAYAGDNPNFDESTGTYRTGAPAGVADSYNSPFGPVRQPHQIGVQDYNNMTDTDRKMQEGLWSAQGIVPADAWTRMRAAQPKGTAQTFTRWT